MEPVTPATEEDRTSDLQQRELVTKLTASAASDPTSVPPQRPGLRADRPRASHSLAPRNAGRTDGSH